MTAWIGDGDHYVLRIGGHEARVMRAFGRQKTLIVIDSWVAGSIGDVRLGTASRAKVLAEAALIAMAERKGTEYDRQN